MTGDLYSLGSLPLPWTDCRSHLYRFVEKEDVILTKSWRDLVCCLFLFQENKLGLYSVKLVMDTTLFRQTRWEVQPVWPYQVKAVRVHAWEGFLELRQVLYNNTYTSLCLFGNLGSLIWGAAYPPHNWADAAACIRPVPLVLARTQHLCDSAGPMQAACIGPVALEDVAHIAISCATQSIYNWKKSHSMKE